MKRPKHTHFARDVKIWFLIASILCFWLSSESKSTSKEDSSSSSSSESEGHGSDNSTILTSQDILDAMSRRVSPSKSNAAPNPQNETMIPSFAMYSTANLIDTMLSNVSRTNDTRVASSMVDVLEHSSPNVTVDNATIYINATNSAGLSAIQLLSCFPESMLLSPFITFIASWLLKWV